MRPSPLPRGGSASVGQREGLYHAKFPSSYLHGDREFTSRRAAGMGGAAPVPPGHRSIGSPAHLQGKEGGQRRVGLRRRGPRVSPCQPQSEPITIWEDREAQPGPARKVEETAHRQWKAMFEVKTKRMAERLRQVGISPNAVEDGPAMLFGEDDWPGHPSRLFPCSPGPHKSPPVLGVHCGSPHPVAAIAAGRQEDELFHMEW